MNYIGNLQINSSERFNKKYASASLSLQGLAEGAIHDLVNLQRAEPKTLLHHYDRLANLSGPNIEVPLCGGHRLIAHYSEDRLILLDMGGHDVVRQYDKNKLVNDLKKHGKAHEQFWPENRSKFFLRFPVDIPYNKYFEEVSPEWLYFLEDEQNAVFEKIANAIINQEHQPHFILGGPGTGKTCIILNLLSLFANDDEYQVGICISDNLRDYIENTTYVDISHYCVDLYDLPPLDILLVDDPENIRVALYLAKDIVSTIVLAFDPLQLPGDFTDQEFVDVSNDFVVCRHVLNDCYRQKENVGKTTKNVVDIVEASTPFLRQDKIDEFRQSRKYLSQLSNDLTFANPFGYTESYLASTVSDITTEVNRILNSEWLMWKHWPGLLVVLDGYILTEEDIVALEPLAQKKYVEILDIDQIANVKGLEYQHVFIFIENTLYEELQKGFKGSGQNEYHRRRMYRIPFSRAKDSLVIFSKEENI